MTRDSILTVLAGRAEAWRRLDADALAAAYTEDAIVESPLAGGTVRGRAQILQVFQAYLTAFPDMEMHEGDVLIDGDRAAVFSTFVGTDRGGFMGMPATGRRVRIPVVFLYQFGEGGIVADRRVYDFTSVLLQVGALKAKPA